MARSHITKPKFWLKILLGILIAIVIGTVFHAINLPVLLQNALQWVNGLGPAGVVAFMVIYNLATVLFIPGSLLTLGGGALYGVLWGTLYVVLAATLGATIAFLIGRYFARGWVSQQIQRHPNFQAIDAAVAGEGFKIVLLTRLSPIFPFNLLNYAFGVTQVSLKDYVLGSVGMIPGTLLYVYIGSFAGDLATLGAASELSAEAQIAQWAVRILGFLATVVVTVYITRIARQALTQKL
jgi:uncharacterized membrane protein YdjX (TVP38/TMEM64 family)